MFNKRIIPVVDYIGNVLEHSSRIKSEETWLDGWTSFTIVEQDDCLKAEHRLKSLIKEPIEIGRFVLISILPKRMSGDSPFYHMPHIEILYRLKGERSNV